MTDYGVTPEGFTKKPLSVILEEIEQAQLDTIDPRLNLLATSVLGQLNGVFADKLRELWDVAQAVYRAAYPDSASAEALDEVAAITGAIRLAATKGRATLDQLFLDGSTTVPAGSVAGVDSDGVEWALLEDAVNSLAYPATVSAEAEAVLTGPLAGFAGTIDTIKTPVSGWTSEPAVSNTIAETYLLAGTQLNLQFNGPLGGIPIVIPFIGGNPWSASDVKDLINAGIAANNQDGEVILIDSNTRFRIRSTLSGPGSSVEILAGTANAVVGLSEVLIRGFNSADADEGRDLETDVEFRQRREELLEIAGTATVEAIRADIRRLDDVIQCLVLENTSLITDDKSIPGKAFRAIVQGGDEQEIADQIWETKPAGILADAGPGGITKTVTDSMGFDHQIGFARPIAVPIYIDATLTTNDDFPVDGVDQVKAALVALGDEQQIGEDVIALQFKAACLTVSGVEDVTVFQIDDVDPPTGTTNISIDELELATFDTGDINIPDPGP